MPSIVDAHSSGIERVFGLISVTRGELSDAGKHLVKLSVDP